MRFFLVFSIFFLIIQPLQAENLVNPWDYPAGIQKSKKNTFSVTSKKKSAPESTTPKSTAPKNTAPKNHNYKIVPNYVETNLKYSKTMFDRQEHVTDKAVHQLKARENGTLSDNTLYIGGRYIGSLVHERTNTDGKFPIISRFPFQHTRGDKDTKDVSNDTSINATVTLPYVTIFAQGEHTDIEYPGQDQTQLRKAFVTIGDLKKFPVYVTIGKKTVNFGKFDSYAPITHNHSSHYFWSQTREPLLEVGYIKNGTEIVGTLMSNDRGLRVVDSPDDNGNYENFALNLTQELDINKDIELELGGGFLRGTIYNSSIAHHPLDNPGVIGDWNGAWNVNGRVSYKKLDVMGEFTQTTDKWPATDHKVSSLTAQAKYNDEVYNLPVIYSLMYSQGIQGGEDTQWHDMEQVVGGIEVDIHPHVTLFGEYLYNEGFVPLIMPTFTGDADVKSHTLILGAELTF